MSFFSLLRPAKEKKLERKREKKTHPLLHRLVVAEHFGLPEHRVDERRLAVVDVRDDRDVADVLAQLGGEALGGLGSRSGGGLGGGGRVGDGGGRDARGAEGS